MNRRVVITGIGAVTPLGLNYRETWDALIRGRQGIGRLQRVRLKDLPFRMAGEVRGFDEVSPFTEKEKRRLDPFIQYLVVSAMEAVRDAGLGRIEDPLIIVGSSRGGVSGMEESFCREKRRIRPSLMTSTMIGMGISAVSERLGVQASGFGVSSACASGAIAVGEAYRAIRAGYATVAITGGTDAPITRFCVEGYGGMGLLSKRADPSASRPFDRERDGFVLAEGAAVMVLEELGHALRRGAGIYAEITGFETLITPDGQIRPLVPVEAGLMVRLIERTGFSPEDVDFVSAHATSTPVGDRVEAGAVFRIFGKRVKVTGLKGATGHMLGASGALETAVTASVLRYGIIPGTVNLKAPEDEMPPISIVREAERGEYRVGITNSFGLGGINASLLLTRYKSL
jgi:3-oxoacyl-[acyl-carrier-protein] synthase II